jgi:hypothetical protein
MQARQWRFELLQEPVVNQEQDLHLLGRGWYRSGLQEIQQGRSEPAADRLQCFSESFPQRVSREEWILSVPMLG